MKASKKGPWKNFIRIALIIFCLIVALFWCSGTALVNYLPPGMIGWLRPSTSVLTAHFNVPGLPPARIDLKPITPLALDPLPSNFVQVNVTVGTVTFSTDDPHYRCLESTAILIFQEGEGTPGQYYAAFRNCTEAARSFAWTNASDIPLAHADPLMAMFTFDNVSTNCSTKLAYGDTKFGLVTECFPNSNAPTYRATPTPTTKSTVSSTPTTKPTTSPTPPNNEYSSVSSVSLSTGEYVYGVRADGAIWETHWDGQWHQPHPITNSNLFPPEASITTLKGTNEDLYVVGKDGAIWETYWDGQWHQPIAITRANLFPPGAGIVAIKGANEDLYAVGKDGAIWETYWDGQWHQPIAITQTNLFLPGASITAVLGANEDVYAIGKDGAIWETYWDGQWHQPFAITKANLFFPGGGIAAVVGANEDLYTVGTDGAIWELYWDSQWHQPFAITGANLFSFGTNIAALKQTNEKVYIVGKDGAIWETYWDGQWHQPSAIT